MSSYKRIDASLIKEIWINFKPVAVFVTGVFGTILGIASAYEMLLSGNGYYESALLCFLLCYVFVLLVVFVYSVCAATRYSFQQHIALSKTGCIEVCEGDYLATIDHVSKQLSDTGISLDQLYCVVGINQTADLSLVSEGSALEAILKRYIGVKTNQPSIDKISLCDSLSREILGALQDDLDQVIACLDEELFECADNENSQRRLISFGTCLCVDLPIVQKQPDTAPKVVFVINSSLDSLHQKEHKAYNHITGPDSIDVIPSVFTEAVKLHVKHLIMPALGTYRLGNSTQSVIGGIVLRYLSALRLMDASFNMTVSLRRSDLERSKTNLSQIKQYIRHAARLYS